jgi:uncharacterized protein (TIGR02172 family)
MVLQQIAHGRTAEVFAWEEGKVVKVYLPHFDPENAAHEAKIAAAVQEAGIACPRFFGLVEVDGRPGLVYERIDGVMMGDMALKRPWRIPALGRRMAALHWQMHQPEISAALPLLRDKLNWRIDRSPLLSAPVKARLLGSLKNIPDGSSLCHGDFHPSNILCSAEKDVIIDWNDTAIGNPMADVARTTILLLGTAAANPNPVFKLVVRWFHHHYLRAYFQSGGDPSIYRAFLPLTAAARLDENLSGEEEAWLLKRANEVTPQ